MNVRTVSNVKVIHNGRMKPVGRILEGKLFCYSPAVDGSDEIREEEFSASDVDASAWVGDAFSEIDEITNDNLIRCDGNLFRLIESNERICRGGRAFLRNNDYCNLPLDIQKVSGTEVVCKTAKGSTYSIGVAALTPVA